MTPLAPVSDARYRWPERSCRRWWMAWAAGLRERPSIKAAARMAGEPPANRDATEPRKDNAPGNRKGLPGAMLRVGVRVQVLH